jgi:hypothetical protein
MATCQILTPKAIRRILTPLDRQAHIRAVVRRFNADPTSHKTYAIEDEGIQMVGDLATLHTNEFHCDVCGGLEFYPDTPMWIREMAVRRGWANPWVLDSKNEQCAWQRWINKTDTDHFKQ